MKKILRCQARLSNRAWHRNIEIFNTIDLDFHLWFSKQLFWQWRVQNASTIYIALSVYFSHGITDRASLKRTNADCGDYSTAFAKFGSRSRTILPRKRSFRCTRTLYSHRTDEIRLDREWTIENELSGEMSRYFTLTSADIKFCGVFIAAARWSRALCHFSSFSDLSAFGLR